MRSIFTQVLNIPEIPRQLPEGAQEPVEVQPDAVAEPTAKPETEPSVPPLE